jgi:hypothetical protein
LRSGHPAGGTAWQAFTLLAELSPHQTLTRYVLDKGDLYISVSFVVRRADPTADTRADPAWQQLSLDEAMGLLLKEGAFGSSPDLRKHIGEPMGNPPSGLLVTKGKF